MNELSNIDNKSKTQLILKQNYLALQPRRCHRDLKKYLDWAYPARSKNLLGEFKLKELISPDASNANEKATRLLEWVPTRKTLEDAIDQFQNALTSKANLQDIAILIGLMIDSYPNTSSLSNISAYINALMYTADEERELSPQIVADAIQSLISENKFVPTVSELIAECDSSTAKFEFATKQIKYLLRHFDAAVDVLSNANKFELIDRVDPIDCWDDCE